MLIAGCASGEVTPKLLPSGSGLEELSTITLTSSRLTTYSIEATTRDNEISEYPVNDWSSQGWKVQKWTREVSSQELQDLLRFLRTEREKYSRSGEYQEQAQTLDRMINKLSKGLSSSSRVAYFYKTRPGTDNYLQGDWLYLYYMDRENRRLIKVTNAFR